MQTKKSGFTLLEILLVVGIIAVLAGIVIVAINPSKQLAQVRNTQRKSDLKQIYNAITQYYIDNSSYPSTISTTTLNEVCNTGSVASTTTALNGASCGTLANLSNLVPTYLTAIPSDPTGTSSLLSLIPTAYAATIATGTGYQVVYNPYTKKIDLNAPIAEIGQTINIGASSFISYQENADVVSAKTSFYQQVTYNKPSGALNSSRWLVKHGTSDPYYISFNSSPAIDCWNASSTALMLRMYSNTNNGGSGALSEPQCYNGSSWVSIGTVAYTTYQWNESVSSNTNPTATDGDWNTFDAWSQYRGVWSNSTTMIPTVRWYEEAMSWNIFI
ncbi:MAG: prepilin-type N-terminal cleavage/methylation domain-containing protein [bacterium]